MYQIIIKNINDIEEAERIQKELQSKFICHPVNLQSS